MSLLHDDRITMELLQARLRILNDLIPQEAKIDHSPYRTHIYELRIHGISGAVYSGTKRELYQYIKGMITGINTYKRANNLP